MSKRKLSVAAKAAAIAASLNSGKPQVSATRTMEFGPNVPQFSDDAIAREVANVCGALVEIVSMQHAVESGAIAAEVLELER